ncbi:Brefeldin A-inhibited guanine nucleotide-exchange protein 1 [Vitis vinifera]|uniref:Brefeldin A-inhibited guanine nucleotide-exchange protein 1 n=1 Tax=Vitis vinifera TaxID=29760 RepID=A0A438EKN7_VITVI|nr:Brefeldin A-inhibited guanine nucleotide-exchange protein 1 [Vitis vinifera]
MEPALECLFKLCSLGLIRGVIDRKGMIEAVCKSAGSGEDAVDLAVLKREWDQSDLCKGGACADYVDCFRENGGGFDGVKVMLRRVVEVPNGSKGDGKTEVDNGEMENGAESSGESVIREDGFLIFKNLCKLSMKFSSQDQSDDLILLRGKILSLELLKVVMNNGGPIWRSNERHFSLSVPAG